ncbi:GHMP kinase [Galbibacter sp. BG1]|uniref:GYDIA family GHMP kinase n=1 Tax=Galbibacter sp. BG1 TaxID=1170699 RepID=UPI0015B8865E|nr:GYDIA family GHMP kinase [Galbibacter sp. BG1]QLE00668.1 GHMP kinase [Galbibacter sp. BG1]
MPNHTPITPTTFRSHGKLLITGEYVVLDGAESFALPTKFGQTLNVLNTQTNKLTWKAFNHKNKEWFSAEFDLNQLKNFDEKSILKSTSIEIAKRLFNFLTGAIQLNPNFLKNTDGLDVSTYLEFPENWGLGSSSTLINNIATWAKVDAYKLLWNSFAGSGYDIACAQHDNPITYQLIDKSPLVNTVLFNPNFKEHLFFIHLNKKQNSREGIKAYRALANQLQKDEAIATISKITTKLINTNNLSSFESLLYEHEQIIATLIQQKTVKQLLFDDFKGSIKSLGAWGGDFVLATGEASYVKPYFLNKGYETILPYIEMIA